MLQKYISFSFCPKSFVHPPSFLRFTVEAIKVTGYNAVMKKELKYLPRIQLFKSTAQK
jgi:hypothetical protein